MPALMSTVVVTTFEATNLILPPTSSINILFSPNTYMLDNNILVQGTARCVRAVRRRDVIAVLDSITQASVDNLNALQVSLQFVPMGATGGVRGSRAVYARDLCVIACVCSRRTPSRHSSKRRRFTSSLVRAQRCVLRVLVLTCAVCRCWRWRRSAFDNHYRDDVLR
jgi:hypothetical protein